MENKKIFFIFFTSFFENWAIIYNTIFFNISSNSNDRQTKWLPKRYPFERPLKAFWHPSERIVQLANSNTLRFWNWSFTNKSCEAQDQRLQVFEPQASFVIA